MRWDAVAMALVGAASAASAQGMELGVKGGMSVAEFSGGDNAFDEAEGSLLLKARFGAGVRPYVFAGPCFGLRLSANAQGDAGDDGTDDVDLEDETKGTDFGLVGGAGVEIGRLLAEARYARGLAGIASDEIDDDIDNAACSVLVGVRF